MQIPFPETLLPTDAANPYYIIAPPYARTSAGICALHVLCHWLNLSGYNAFLYLIPAAEGLGINPRLQTPILDAKVVAHHFNLGLTPVVVCPEVIPGNPFGATVRVRWVGNYPGLLGGASVFDDEEICFAHSAHLARAIGVRANILCIPVVDTTTFRPSPSVLRRGACYYANKFKNVHGQSVFGLPMDAVEITRSTPATRSELAALFQRSELFYCFEDSALMNEAALCGCPVVMMKNDFFGWPLGIEEVGWDGYAWGNDPSEIERAKLTVARAFDNYICNIPRFFSQLHNFVLLTQRRAQVIPYRRQVSLPGDDVVVDERRRLRQALADALIKLSTLNAAPGAADTLWMPDLTIMGAQSAVTFVSGWKTIDVNGAMASDSCSLMVCPGNAATIDLTLELIAAAPASKDFNVTQDFDVHRRLTLTPGRAINFALAVMDAGRPFFITITDIDPRHSGSLLLKAVVSTQREQIRLEPLNAEASVPLKAIRSAGVQIAIDETLGGRLQVFNCSIDYRGADLIVDAFAPDPHMLIDIDFARVQGLTMPAFLWGVYEVDRDETLQVYMPTGPSSSFAESVSCRVTLKRGRDVFVIRLPRAAAFGPIRIDPLDLAGRVSFSFLRLVFFRAPDPPLVARSEAPGAPRLERFERQSLLDGTAFPLPDRCVTGFSHNAFEVRVEEAEASIIFYLAKPIQCVQDRPVSIYLAFESTLSGRLIIRFPDTEGTFEAHSIAKEASIIKGYQTLEFHISLLGPIQSLQIVLHQVDAIRFLEFEVAVAK